jgi:hypothetical protein
MQSPAPPNPHQITISPDKAKEKEKQKAEKNKISLYSGSGGRESLAFDYRNQGKLDWLDVTLAGNNQR